MSPLGKVPALKVGDTVLFESQVILEYLNELYGNSQVPTDPSEKAKYKETF